MFRPSLHPYRSTRLLVTPAVIVSLMVVLGFMVTITAQPVSAMPPAISPGALDSSFGQVPELIYYRFDTAGTTVANQASSPVGTNPAPIVGQTVGNSGQFGSALVGTGGSSTTDFVNTGWAPNLGTGSWTISFWTANVPSSSTVFYFFGDVNSNSLRAFTNGIAGAGNVILRGGGSTDVLVTGAATSEPNVVTFVYDSTVPEIRAYKNGVLVNTVSQSSVNINGSGPFKVGGYSSNTGLGSGQLLDEFRLYSHALSAEEVSATWNQSLPLPIAPVITGITTDSSPQIRGITRDATISLNGTAEAGNTVTLTRAGVGVIGTATANGAGAWSFDYTSTSLPTGSHSFTATATDSVGNVSSSDAFVVTVLGPILYVNDNATGANTGASWVNAFISLQDALAVAISGDQIWVAAGSYTPSTSGDRNASFTPKSGVALYGGFAGTETQLSTRNWTTNVTTLSGDLNGNDSGFTNNGENSYHVVTGVTGATLDGFTISSGNASGSDTNIYGGGIYNYNSSPTLNNLIISRNVAGYGGGGIYNFTSSPILTNVTISSNTATVGGSLFNTGSSSPTLTNVTISSNSATDRGGGLFNYASSPTLTNVTISGNQASGGGGMFNEASSLTLTNVTISGNQASGDGGGVFNNNSSPTLTNVTISGNQASSGGGIYNVSGSSPTLTNVTISGNQASGGGGMFNEASSPTLTNVTISGNQASGDGGGVFNNNSSPTLTNVTISGNQADDGGGVFNNNSSPTLANVTISGNQARDWGGGIANWHNSKPTLTNVTISSNRSVAGGAGIDNYDTSTWQIRNSIIWGNRMDTGRVSSISNDRSSVSVSYSLVEGGYAGTGNTSNDPQFVSQLAASSAPTTSGDYRLQATSPAIDVGDNSVVSASTDLAGNPRRIDLPGIANAGNGTAPIVDMGAYEVPVVAISSITRQTPASSLTNAASVTFEVVFAESPSGVDTSDFSIALVSGGLSGTSVTGVSGSGTTYSVTVTTGSGEGVLRLEPAAVTQVVNAAGAPAGLSTFPSGETYTIDKTTPAAPTIASITTDSGTPGDGITNDQTLILDGTAGAGSMVTLSRDGVVIGTTTANGLGSWSYDYTATILLEGSYSFTATAADAAGNTSDSSSAFAVTVDKTVAAPVITGITTDSGTPDDGITNDQTLVLSGSAEPNSTVTLSRVNVGLVGTATADGTGAWSYDYTGTILSEGSYSFSATATDLAGNTSSPSTTFVVTVQAGAIWYVNDDASGANDGSSWVNAYTNLQAALNAATSGDQIWVAAGTYKPTTGSDRNVSFELESGMSLYGGFAGSETQLSQRNWTANVTILSGDLNSNDGPNFANNGENSFHVVIGATGATLDGFTISGGNAGDFGGGILSNGASPTLRNLIISGNRATYSGGGIYTKDSPTLTNVIISGNSANGAGGLYLENGSPILTNVIISGNTANGDGGGIVAFNSSAILTNVTISGNSAGSGGGMRTWYSSNLQIRNSIIWGNTASDSPSAIVEERPATVSYSIVEGGYTGSGNRDADPVFVAVVPTVPSIGGDLRLQATSPAIDAGNNDVSSPSLPGTDRDGNPRRSDMPDVPDTGKGTAPIVDMGAYEVVPPNQAPTLDQPGDQAILEDAGAQTINLSGIGAGSGESQTLTITTVSSNPTLIPNPIVSYTSPNASGSLSFTPLTNANGTARITVTVHDNGGTANGGTDTLTLSFTVQVTPVNDAPSFTAGPNQMVASNAGPVTISNWASGFSAGPSDEANQTLLGYTIVSNTNMELFSVAPAIDASGALTYTPKPGASGAATIGVVVRDSGGTASGGADTSTVRTFTITVGGINRVYLPLVRR